MAYPEPRVRLDLTVECIRVFWRGPKQMHYSTVMMLWVCTDQRYYLLIARRKEAFAWLAR